MLPNSHTPSLHARTALAMALALALCSLTLPALADDLPVGFGATPDMPAAKPQSFPTLKVYSTAPWKGAATPQAGSGLKVNAFAQGLDHPRWLLVLPNGDVLVAESNKPTASGGSQNLLQVVMKWVQSLVGAGTKSADRITLLRDQDGDGVAETRSVLLSGLAGQWQLLLAVVLLVLVMLGLLLQHAAG